MLLKGQEVKVTINTWNGEKTVNGLIMHVSKKLVEVNTCYGTALVSHNKVKNK